MQRSWLKNCTGSAVMLARFCDTAQSAGLVEQDSANLAAVACGACVNVGVNDVRRMLPPIDGAGAIGKPSSMSRTSMASTHMIVPKSGTLPLRRSATSPKTATVENISVMPRYVISFSFSRPMNVIGRMKARRRIAYIGHWRPFLAAMMNDTNSSRMPQKKKNVIRVSERCIIGKFAGAPFENVSTELSRDAVVLNRKL